MTVGRMTAAYDDSVSSSLKRLYNEKSVDTSSAGEADYAHIGGHGKTARSGKIGARVGTPIANERDNVGFEQICCFSALR